MAAWTLAQLLQIGQILSLKTLNIIVLTHELEENPSASKPPSQQGLNPC